MRKFPFYLVLVLNTVFLPSLCFGDSDRDPHTLSVNGEATLYKPADQLSIALGVVTEGETAANALEENNRNMQNVFKALEGLGLTKDELQTQRFTISPVYSQPPKNPPSEWQAKIVGYRVSNILQVKTEKLDLAGKIVDAANQAGANSVEQITFSLKDPRAYRAEAIASAAKNAMADAKALADAAGLKLEKVLEMKLDPDASPQPLYKTAMLYSARGSAPGTQIESGDIEVKAKVSVIYQIED